MLSLKFVLPNPTRLKASSFCHMTPSFDMCINNQLNLIKAYHVHCFIYYQFMITMTESDRHKNTSVPALP